MSARRVYKDLDPGTILVVMAADLPNIINNKHFLRIDHRHQPRFANGVVFTQRFNYTIFIPGVIKYYSSDGVPTGDYDIAT